MHGGRHGGDNVGAIMGNAVLPGHVIVLATSTACPWKSVWSFQIVALCPRAPHCSHLYIPRIDASGRRGNSG